jgi:hypothetical protein
LDDENSDVVDTRRQKDRRTEKQEGSKIERQKSRIGGTLTVVFRIQGLWSQ